MKRFICTAFMIVTMTLTSGCYVYPGEVDVTPEVIVPVTPVVPYHHHYYMAPPKHHINHHRNHMNHPRHFNGPRTDHHIGPRR